MKKPLLGDRGGNRAGDVGAEILEEPDGEFAARLAEGAVVGGGGITASSDDQDDDSGDGGGAGLGSAEALREEGPEGQGDGPGGAEGGMMLVGKALEILLQEEVGEG